MAKIVKKKTGKVLEVKTPYPKEEKVKQKSDKDYWGEKMVKLQDRVNELELTVNDMHNKLKVVTGRMGL
tara:strand:- start:201 stop:407 length:207 start_codon:yes stop_codon:yes gene_type:complete